MTPDQPAAAQPREFWTDGDELYQACHEDIKDSLFQLVRKTDYDAVVAERDELRLAKPNAGSTDTLTEKYQLRKENEALRAELLTLKGQK